MAIISILLTATIIIVAILLVLVVLVQRPKQEGLGAAFGGGAFDSALGAHTTDVLQKITTYLAVIYFVSAVGLAMVKARQFSSSPANNVLEGIEATEATPPAGMPEGFPQLPSSVGPVDPKDLIDEVINTPLDSEAAKEAPAPGKGAPKDAKADAPKAKADAPKAKADAPKAKADAPKAKADAPKAKADAPKAKADPPKAKADPPKAKADAPKAKADPPKEAVKKDGK